MNAQLIKMIRNVSVFALLVGAGGACSSPPGVECSEHDACGNGLSCGEGLSCFDISGCETPICISRDQACDESCNGKCEYQDSDPLAIRCKNGSPADGNP